MIYFRKAVLVLLMLGNCMPSFTQVQDVMKDESLGTKAAKALVTSEKAIGYFESKQFKEAIQWADSSLYYGRELNNLKQMPKRSTLLVALPISWIALSCLKYIWNQP